MAIAAGENIIATTLERYFTSGKAVDNIFARTAVLDFLKRRAKIDAQGGRNAVKSVMGAQNTTFQTYSGYDTLTPAVDEIDTTAEYSWKQAAIYIPMSGLEAAVNSGDKAVIKLLTSKTENAEMTAAESFEAMLFRTDHTDAQEFKSLVQIVGDATTDAAVNAELAGQGNLGGILSAEQAWWVSPVDTTSEALTLTKLSNMYNNVSYGADKCDFEVTSQVLYEKYEALLQADQRFTDASTGKAGFDNLIHKGGVVVWSDYCPDTDWYFLNSRHIDLTVLSGKWMNFKGFVQPYDQDAEYGLILSYGEFCTDGRRYLGVLNGQTTA